MKIVSVTENKKIERRIAITPEIAKKYIALGLDVILSENYADHLRILDFQNLIREQLLYHLKLVKTLQYL